MKTNKPVKNHRKGRKVAFVAAVMAAAVLIVLFTPAGILDILMTVNLFLSLAIFLAVVFTGNQDRKKGYEENILSKETDAFSALPVVLLLCAMFGLAVYAAFTRSILAKGAAADSKIIVFLSGLVSVDGTAGIIVGFTGLVILCAAMIFAIRGSTRIVEVSARFFVDSIPGVIMAIDHIYTSGKISEEVCIARKDHIKKQSDFMEAMHKTGKFIAGNAKVAIFIIAAGIPGKFITGTELYGQTIQEVAEVSIAFGISGVIFLLSLLLLSITVNIASSRVTVFFTSH
jgi:flagellar biosynthesis protein FlhA